MRINKLFQKIGRADIEGSESNVAMSVSRTNTTP